MASAAAILSEIGKGCLYVRLVAGLDRDEQRLGLDGRGVALRQEVLPVAPHLGLRGVFGFRIRPRRPRREHIRYLLHCLDQVGRTGGGLGQIVFVFDVAPDRSEIAALSFHQSLAILDHLFLVCRQHGDGTDRSDRECRAQHH